MDTKIPTLRITSGFIQLGALYQGTYKITLEYNDQNGWLIRCYDEQGQKIGTLQPNILSVTNKAVII